jgi:putative AlgH/UPF0301 family transcriptional regulator
MAALGRVAHCRNGEIHSAMRHAVGGEEWGSGQLRDELSPYGDWLFLHVARNGARMIECLWH